MPDTNEQDFDGNRFNYTWCVLPWIQATSLTDGSTQLCCVAEKTSGTSLNSQTIQDYWNSDYTRSVRLQMLKGKKVATCRRCYEEKTNGYQSHRLTENKNRQDRLGFDYISELVKEASDSGSLSRELLSVDLRPGNTCNLQCIMCQPRESSKWVVGAEKLLEHITHSDFKSEWKYKQNIKIDSYEWYKNEDFWSNLKTVTTNFENLKAELNEPFDKFDGIVSFMNSEDQSSKLTQFSDYCRALDLSRNTDRFKVFPAFKEVF